MSPFLSRSSLFAAALAGAALAGCRVTDVPLWKPTAVPDAGAVEVVRDVCYRPGSAAGRHRLDLYAPAGRKDCPVVLLVHGGAWRLGDNRCCGLYPSVGEFLARQGVVAVLPNYRLSPAARHPDHVRDLARAFAWVRDHAADYGGDPGRIFLLGHSAGGHLVSLLATDEKYLKAEGHDTTDVKGVVAVSGVYRIPAGGLAVALGGTSPQAFRLDEVFPVRGEGGRGVARLLPGIPLDVDVFGPAFGDDPRAREDASPINHVRPNLPPFLILSAENDLPALPEMAEEFGRALEAKGCDMRLVRVKERNHNSILFRAVDGRDPVAAAVLDFIRR